MSQELRLAAKRLAALALPEFCPRCFWYREHCGDGPFSIFPSIFNVIDLFTKKLVHSHIDTYGHPPKWMGSVFAEATGYSDPGRMSWVDEDNSILLRGSLDGLFHNKDKSRWFLGDYKTARYSQGQDRLLPLYRMQLLAYAFLLVKSGYKKPDAAALFYFQPPADPTAPELRARTEKDGFVLPLSLEVVDIELGNFKPITDLLGQARKIYDAEDAPEGREKCRDCMRIDRYIRQSKFDSRPGEEVVAIDKVFDYRKSRWVTVFIKGEKGGDVAILDVDTDEWYPDWEDEVE